MKPDPARAERENTARFVFQALSALPHPGDAAAVIALVHAMLISTQRVRDEAKVREMLARIADITVEMWKAQGEATKGAANAKDDNRAV